MKLYLNFLIRSVLAIIIICNTQFVEAKKKKTNSKTKKNVETQIHDLELKRYDAMVKMDTAQLSSMLHKNMEYYHSNGMMNTKQSLLEDIANKKLVHKSIVVNKENIRIYKEVAIVTGEADYDVVWNEKPMQMHFVFTNVYIKKKKGWVLVNRQTVKI